MYWYWNVHISTKGRSAKESVAPLRRQTAPLRCRPVDSFSHDAKSATVHADGASRLHHDHFRLDKEDCSPGLLTANLKGQKWWPRWATVFYETAVTTACSSTTAHFQNANFTKTRVTKFSFRRRGSTIAVVWCPVAVGSPPLRVNLHHC